jgi:hypothetical protein
MCKVTVAEAYPCLGDRVQLHPTVRGGGTVYSFNPPYSALVHRTQLQPTVLSFSPPYSASTHRTQLQPTVPSYNVLATVSSHHIHCRACLYDRELLLDLIQDSTVKVEYY